LRFGATLLAFFFSSSKLTQFKEELKEGLDEDAKKGGQRDWKQVGALGTFSRQRILKYSLESDRLVGSRV
jgi:uncharacterized membrane protein